MKITKFDDYLDQIYEEFDKVDKVSVRGAVKHALCNLVYFKSLGLDINIANGSNDYWFFVGDTPLANEDNYRLSKKRRIKLRAMYARRKMKYDGYYYFSLDEASYQEHLKGTLKEYTLYRVSDECNIYRKATHKFRVAMDAPPHWRVCLEEVDPLKTEYLNMITNDETTNI